MSDAALQQLARQAEAGDLGARISLWHRAVRRGEAAAPPPPPPGGLAPRYAAACRATSAAWGPS